MNDEIVTVRNKATRRTGKVRRLIAEHPVFGEFLDVVPDGSKDFVPLDELNPGLFDTEDLEDPDNLEGKDEVEA